MSFPSRWCIFTSSSLVRVCSALGNSIRGVDVLDLFDPILVLDAFVPHVSPPCPAIGPSMGCSCGDQ